MFSGERFLLFSSISFAILRPRKGLRIWDFGLRNEERRKAQGARLKAIWVIYSRSLRSAQSRKRVPSLASPSLGHYAELSFIVRGIGQIGDLRYEMWDWHGAESIGHRVKRDERDGER